MIRRKKNSWLSAFRFAFNGIYIAFLLERNMKIHFFIAIFVFFLAYFYEISKVEFILLVIAVMAVVITEMINTAIEKVVDFISPQFHKEAKKIKDLAAGAVLLAAFSSVIIGYFIFFDKIFK